MKNIIITGVTGQDGSYMTEYLLEHTDYHIIGVARRVSNPNYSNLDGVLGNPRFSIVSGDLGDSHSINNLVQEYQPEYFINFAAQSHVHESWRVPEQTFDTDATGVLRILEAARKYAPNCRIYNAGSSEEFGNVLYSPQDEQHPLRPRSPYGAAKAAARHLTKVYRESYNLYAIQGALFNHESRKRGQTFVTKRITKNVARIYHHFKNLYHQNYFEPLSLGNLDAKRDWSHAKDFVEGIWMMLNQEKYVDFLKDSTRDELPKNIKEYILSSQETHSVREFVELSFKFANFESLFSSPISFEWRGAGVDEQYILKHAGFEYVLVNINKELFRPAEVELLLGDSSKARKELGWSPKYSFEDLVKEMVENDIKNP